jgi:hypothetical protein
MHGSPGSWVNNQLVAKVTSTITTSAWPSRRVAKRHPAVRMIQTRSAAEAASSRTSSTDGRYWSSQTSWSHTRPARMGWA